MRSFLLVDFLPGVLEGYGAVEDEASGGRVGVEREVAYALELQGHSGLGYLGQIGLYLDVLDRKSVV